MGVADLIQKFQFVVDSNGEKQAVLIDYAVWEKLLNLLEDLEDRPPQRKSKVESPTRRGRRIRPMGAG